MKITADTLNGTHLGKTTTVTSASDTTVTGMITGIEHDTDLIDDTNFGDGGVTRYILGNRYVTITILGGHKTTLRSRTEIEVNE